MRSPLPASGWWPGATAAIDIIGLGSPARVVGWFATAARGLTAASPLRIGVVPVMLAEWGNTVGVNDMGMLVFMRFGCPTKIRQSTDL